MHVTTKIACLSLQLTGKLQIIPSKLAAWCVPMILVQHPACLKEKNWDENVMILSAKQKGKQPQKDTWSRHFKEGIYMHMIWKNMSTLLSISSSLALLSFLWGFPSFWFQNAFSLFPGTSQRKHKLKVAMTKQKNSKAKYMCYFDDKESVLSIHTYVVLLHTKTIYWLWKKKL